MQDMTTNTAPPSTAATEQHATTTSVPVNKLARYSFLWSEVRLIIAAVALFLGGVPPVLAFNPFAVLFGLLSQLLILAWMVSGVAAGYLIYCWFRANKTVFGDTEPKDITAFFVLIVSGLNLGFAGFSTINIGLSVTKAQPVLLIVGLLYLATATYLFARWKKNKENLFPQ